MHSDPIADFMIRIKNGYLANKPEVRVPYAKVKAEISKILEQEGFIDGSTQTDKELVITLRYTDRVAALTDVKRVSKPGLRTYVSKKHVPSVLRGRGIAIISTSQGLMTDRQAREKGIGGELVAKVW